MAGRWMSVAGIACTVVPVAMAVACSSGGAGGETSTGDTSSTATTQGATSATDESGESGTTGGEQLPPLQDLCPDGLPFDLTRPAQGDPVAAGDLADVTSRYLELIEGTRYFEFIAERIHGWPESDPTQRYWFGTWWSGVTVVKQGGEITYRHEESGADNNGLRTAPMLEGACYAHALWQDPTVEHSVRAMMRGLSAWILAMEREPDDPAGPMLSRAFYPESIDAQEGGLQYVIDYSLNRPGVDASPSEYVHVPNNPHWGDIWIKNKRSKDDIGHMVRALAQLGACEDTLTTPEAGDDLAEVRDLYRGWARKVDDDDWRIQSLDKQGEPWFPPDLLARFVVEAECDALLSLRLLGRAAPGEIDCGNGIGRFDDLIIAATDHNGNILRSFHEAAANGGLITGQHDVARALLEGLTIRIDEGLDGFDGVGEPVPWLTNEDQADLMLHSAAAGVPLTSRDVRFLHARIDEAHASYLDPSNDPILRTFDADVPDGEYFYRPNGIGLEFRSLAVVLAACASPCWNPTSEPLLDCDMVRAWQP